MVLSEFVARNNGALSTLVNKHKVQLKNFPGEILKGLGNLANQVMNDIASKDPLSREVRWMITWRSVKLHQLGLLDRRVLIFLLAPGCWAKIKIELPVRQLV